MFAEIITIGDELLIGQVLDTNSAWMGRELNKNGIEVLRIVSVRDREEEIIEAVSSAMKRVSIVLISGGLGPTKDDITKQTLCRYFNTEMVFNQAVFDNVKRVLADKISMNQLNRNQAMVPKDCLVINNRVGTASISWFERDDRIVVSMPGVPQEMKTVMTEEVIPRLVEKFHTDAIVHRTFVVQNYAESVLALKLETWEDALPECVKLAYLPKPGIIRLRLTGRGEDKSALENIIDREGEKLLQILGDAILTEEDAPIETIIGDLLRKKKLTIATAESCTGGNIAARLTSISGSSDYYKGSVVAYIPEVKETLLQVPLHVIEQFGVVSEETVVAMVRGAMKVLQTDCAVATTGIAGPTGGTDTISVGSIWIAAAFGDRIITKLQKTNRGREINIERAGNNALLMLRQLLG
jgi:nicotinamide-nucleotide amidase